ncbi:phosphotransferase family protein [Saccharopolyspora pogona]|uniref:phosphotransferase family protein n=1 Tax=Saccharopolyspora pogona TaxID=333966 RepID=UPI001CC263F4|nr:phosphotransferase family protein [Saccharopolyspora pogona]
MNDTMATTPPEDMAGHDGSPPGIDLRALRAYLDTTVPGLVSGDLRAVVLAGGHSNLTFDVGDGAGRWVLRRPPLGERQSASHDMGREYRVMGALADSVVPVPEVLHHCEDPSVIGAPFHLSVFVEGTVYRATAQTALLGAERVREISFELVDVLADLHGVNPEAVGLGDFGRPAGFLQRQVARWTGQAEEVLAGFDGVETLVERLRTGMPQSLGSALVHGDYRLDNVMVSGDGHIVAVLDWEMAAFGDPLTDLGLLQCYWDGVENPGGDGMRKGIDPALGFPEFGELAERYAARTGTDPAGLSWYTAFGYLKLAVLRGRIHQRFVDGNTPEGFDKVGDLIAPLVDQSRLTLERA